MVFDIHVVTSSFDAVQSNECEARVFFSPDPQREENPLLGLNTVSTTLLLYTS